MKTRVFHTVVFLLLFGTFLLSCYTLSAEIGIDFEPWFAVFAQVSFFGVGFLFAVSVKWSIIGLAACWSLLAEMVEKNGWLLVWWEVNQKRMISKWEASVWAVIFWATLSINLLNDKPNLLWVILLFAMGQFCIPTYFVIPKITPKASK